MLGRDSQEHRCSLLSMARRRSFSGPNAQKRDGEGGPEGRQMKFPCPLTLTSCPHPPSPFEGRPRDLTLRSCTHTGVTWRRQFAFAQVCSGPSRRMQCHSWMSFPLWRCSRSHCCCILGSNTRVVLMSMILTDPSRSPPRNRKGHGGKQADRVGGGNGGEACLHTEASLNSGGMEGHEGVQNIETRPTRCCKPRVRSTQLTGANGPWAQIRMGR